MTMRHNLLVISGDAKLNARLQAALGGDCALMAIDPRSENAESVAARFSPDGILIDAGMHAGAKTILERIAAIRARYPEPLLIVVGDEMSAQLVLAAFRAGAQEFLDREASDMDMRKLVLSRLGEREPVGRAGAVEIGVLSPAMAAEDYDLALNIAALLASADKNRRVLFLDLCLPASPARAALGLELPFTAPAAIREISRLDRTFLDSALARAAESGLYVLPLSDDAAEPASLPAWRDILVLLQMLRGVFDAVVVYWGAYTRQAALSPSDGAHFFLCCNQRFSSIRNAKALLTAMKAEPVLAIHQLDAHAAPAPDDICAATGAARHLVLRANWAALAQAENRGRPLGLSGPSHYADALRSHLAAEGLLAGAAPDHMTTNLLRWLHRRGA